MIKDLKILLFKVGLLFVVLALVGQNVQGQDSHLSQYYVSEMANNPALTGRYTGVNRGILQYRSQWKSVAQKAFQTAFAGYDQPKGRFGFGGYVLNNKAGFSGFSTLNFMVSGSHEVSIDPNRIHHLTYGVQLGFVQKKLDVDALSFNNQYTKNNGGIFDPVLPSNEYFDRTLVTLPESSFGIMYKRTSSYSKVNPYLGMAAFHLTEPTETLFGQENVLPRRYVVHGGAKIRAIELIDLHAHFLYMKQVNDNNLLFGVEGSYDIQGSQYDALFGLSYRNKDAIIFQLGASYEEYILRFSYDMNVSSLSQYSRGRGAMEISLIYTKKKGKYAPSIDI